MRARWLLNLLLLLLVTGLGVVAYLRPGLEAPESPATLSSLLPEHVQQLQIERAGHASIKINRTADGWQLIHPIKLRANRFRIEPLLQIRRAISHSSFSVVTTSLEQYELVQPAVVLQLDNERYAFGGVEVLNGYRYVMVGDTVHLLSDRIHNHLQMSPYDFVSLQLLPPSRTVTAARIGAHEIDDALLLGMWRETEARRVSAYTAFNERVEQMELRLDDGSALLIDILQRESEVVLGLRARGVKYHFRIDEGERLLPMVGEGDA